jgi:hypothetical protein
MLEDDAGGWIGGGERPLKRDGPGLNSLALQLVVQA